MSLKPLKVFSEDLEIPYPLSPLHPVRDASLGSL
jgi:hypothetical protein